MDRTEIFEISQAIKTYSHKTEWSMQNGDYNTLEWYSQDIPKPTLQEINQIREKIKTEKPWKHLRTTRNSTLSETDWTQTNDIGLENEDEWVAYRQALRDLPANTEDPINPVWPEQPQVKIVQGKNIRTDLQTTRTELADAKTELKADLSETKADLSDTKSELKADLQTIQTQLNPHTHPLEPHTPPLEEHTHPLEPHTHPLEEHTHPLEEHTHPDLVDQLTIEKAKTRELQQRLTLIEHSHAALVARLEALENI